MNLIFLFGGILLIVAGAFLSISQLELNQPVRSSFRRPLLWLGLVLSVLGALLMLHTLGMF